MVKSILFLIGLVLIGVLTGVPAALAEEEDILEVEDILRLYEVDLIGKGEKVLRVGFSYSDDTIIGFWGEQRASSFRITTGLTYGLTRDLDLRIDLPWVFREQTVIAGGYLEEMSGEGLGDITLGIRYQVLPEDRLLWERFSAPSVVLGLSYKLDNARSPYDRLGEGELSVGSGHRNMGLELIISRVVDPVLIYGLGQYLVTFERKHDNISIDPGDIFAWELGIGFAVNPWVSIGGGVEGSVINETEFNGVKDLGSDQVLFNSFLNLTYNVTEDLRFTVETTLGISEESPDFILGTFFSYTF
ncbi:transporter [candidate division NPL-UPA2 bacterium]|nr:transporter [candidate division NPL-UPA2 bacterium]